MGKLLSWILLAVLVIIVPLGSWYYLSQGLNYRIKALAELKPKDSIAINIDSLNLFKRKTTLLVLHTTTEIEGNVTKVKDQFKNTDGFQILTRDSLTDFNMLPSGYMASFLSKYNDKDYIIIDTASRIRNSYIDKTDIKKMVEHLAIVIPRLKETDIKMKR